MRYTIAADARPQLKLLIIATVISALFWIASIYLPPIAFLLYPLQLFATFIHEGSHVLASILTGGSVRSLTVSPDTSGEVYSSGGGGLSQLFTSTAGYVGTTAFGAALLAWIRFGLSPRKAFYVSAGFIGVLTIIFGIFAPVLNLFATVTLRSMAFTLAAGTALTAAGFTFGRLAPLKWVNFGVAFLAVQSLLNALVSLLELFIVAGFTSRSSDAANMAAATGLPAIFWVFLWIVISVVLISVGIRLYAVSRLPKTETVFAD